MCQRGSFVVDGRGLAAAVRITTKELGIQNLENQEKDEEET